MDFFSILVLLIIGVPIVWIFIDGILSSITDAIKQKIEYEKAKHSDYHELRKTVNEEREKINQEKLALSDEQAKLEEERDSLREKYKKSVEELNERFEDCINSETTKRFDKAFPSYKKHVQEVEDLRKKLTPSPEMIGPLLDQYNSEVLFQSLANGRLNNAFDSFLTIKDIDISANIFSENRNTYHTTLKHCNCKDFQIRHVKCKHMLFLAYAIGMLQIQKSGKGSVEALIKSASEKAEILNKQISMANEQLERIETVKDAAEKIIYEKSKAYPSLAAVVADIKTIYYEESARKLETKVRPALSAATTIRDLRRDTKKTLAQSKEYEYKLNYIRELFPNIDDVFEPDFNEADCFELETEENTDRTRLYLSPEEYQSLSITERNQLALDRYLKNRKSKWQVGRDYEMYIGYLCEQRGYNVKYTGIIEKFEDMGRDLVATHGNDIVIIQCKNWSQEKTIHEKHIFQLFGTVVQYQLEKKTNGNVVGVFVTTTTLSETAKRVASHLGIIAKENIPLNEFPRIKCNINRQSGEKIYHLPFDQQYDSAVINKKSGECYVFSVQEAEGNGFRRAMRHFSSSV